MKLFLFIVILLCSFVAIDGKRSSGKSKGSRKESKERTAKQKLKDIEIEVTRTDISSFGMKRVPKKRNLHKRTGNKK